MPPEWKPPPDGEYFVQHLRQGAGYTLKEGKYYCQFAKRSTFFSANGGAGVYEALVFRFYPWDEIKDHPDIQEALKAQKKRDGG